MMTRFLIENKIEYNKKIDHPKGTIFDYNEYFIWTIYKCNFNVEEEFIILFANNSIIDVEIDNKKRKIKNLKILQHDFELSKSIKIKIKKPVFI